MRRLLLVGLLMACAGRSTVPASSPEAVEAAERAAARLEPGPPVRVDEELAGRAVRRLVVPNARGAVLLFHGLGGSADAWLARGEMRTFAEGLAAAGYTVVAVGSGDQVQRRWDVSGLESVDVAALRTIVMELQARGDVAVGTPWYGVGHSQGGAFVVLAGVALGLDAIVVSHAAGLPRAALSGAPVPPVLFITSTEDSVVPAVRVRLGYEAAVRSGVTARLVERTPTPVDPAVFVAAMGGDVEGGEALRRALVAARLLDASGRVSAHPLLERSKWEAAVATVRPEGASDVLTALRDPLLVAAAEHPFTASVLPEVLAWWAEAAAR